MQVVKFLSKLIRLRNELENYVRVPPCSCGVSKKMIKMMEDDKVHQFLMAYDDDVYGTIQSQILALDSLPLLDKIFNMTQQEQAHKKIMITQASRTEANAAAFAVGYLAKSSKSYTDRPTCKHCGRWVMKRQVAGRLSDTRLARATMVNAEVKPGEGEAVAVGKVALEEETLAEKLPIQPIIKQK